MNRRISSTLLALLLTLSLTGCGTELQGSASTSTLVHYGASDSYLPVLDLEGPEDSQDPGNQPDASADPSGSPNAGSQSADKGGGQDNRTVDEDGWYDSKEDVALYLYLYGELPDNYVTKAEAETAGWTGGNVERYTGEGTALGGSWFGNYEGLLPAEEGRTYTECDVDTVGENSRGAKRIVFSNDGLIYYTEDHYESFELLYGEP